MPSYFSFTPKTAENSQLGLETTLCWNGCKSVRHKQFSGSPFYGDRPTISVSLQRQPKIRYLYSKLPYARTVARAYGDRPTISVSLQRQPKIRNLDSKLPYAGTVARAYGDRPTISVSLQRQPKIRYLYSKLPYARTVARAFTPKTAENSLLVLKITLCSNGCKSVRHEQFSGSPFYGDRPTISVSLQRQPKIRNLDSKLPYAGTVARAYGECPAISVSLQRQPKIRNLDSKLPYAGTVARAFTPKTAENSLLVLKITLCSNGCKSVRHEQFSGSPFYGDRPTISVSLQRQPKIRYLYSKLPYAGTVARAFTPKTAENSLLVLKVTLCSNGCKSVRHEQFSGSPFYGDRPTISVSLQRQPKIRYLYSKLPYAGTVARASVINNSRDLLSMVNVQLFQFHSKDSRKFATTE
ncbi:unnamed protein product [Caenorhabditis brenneri]